MMWTPLVKATKPPHLNWAEFAPQPNQFWIDRTRTRPLRLSSVFSGIGSESAALGLLLHSAPADRTIPTVHSATFELRRAARDTLRVLSDCPLFGDLMDLLRPRVRKRVCQKDPPSSDELERLIIGEQVLLAHEAWCHRAGRFVTIDLGDIAVCGVPCIDYSLMGLRRGLSGPTAVVLMLWVRLLQIHQPSFVIVEEVVQFKTRGLPFIRLSDAHAWGNLQLRGGKQMRDSGVARSRINTGTNTKSSTEKRSTHPRTLQRRST